MKVGLRQSVQPPREHKKPLASSTPSCASSWILLSSQLNSNWTSLEKVETEGIPYGANFSEVKR